MKNYSYRAKKTYKKSTSKPAYIPYTVYLSQVRANIIEPVYILFGGKQGFDHPAKSEFIAELKSADDYKLNTFQIPENEALKNEQVNEFLSKIFTQSLWGDKMLLVLKDFQNLSENKQVEILNKLKTIPRNYFATIIIESKFRNELTSLFNDYNFPVLNFYPPDARILVQYIYEMAKSLGLVIDSESAKILMDLVGTDFTLLNQELEKIKTFLGSKNRITPDTVLNACGFSKESSIDDLIIATFNRNTSRSLSNLYRLQNDRVLAVIIVGSMANNGFQLLQIKLGASQKSIGSGKISRKRFEALENQSRLWTAKELTNFLLELAKIDKKIKTGYPEPFVLLESLLVKSTKDFDYSKKYAS